MVDEVGSIHKTRRTNKFCSSYGVEKVDRSQYEEPQLASRCVQNVDCGTTAVSTDILESGISPKTFWKQVLKTLTNAEGSTGKVYVRKNI